MNQKLYVGGLNAATNAARLREVFAEYGEITEAKVITHRDIGASRGFAFVTYTDEASGEKAISARNSSDPDGSTIIPSMSHGLVRKPIAAAKQMTTGLLPRLE